MKPVYYFLCAFLLCSSGLIAQNESNTSATYSGKIGSVRIAPSLASKDYWEPAEPLTETPKDGRSSKNLVVPGKDPQTEDDFYAKNPHRLKNTVKNSGSAIIFDVNSNVGPPSDPALAVGPDHVFIVYNTGFIIYDKDGVDLTGPLNVNNIFSNGGCCDLTASYDSAAERWVITYLFVGNGAEIAISDGPDPIDSDWYVYSIPQINDYQKLSVWSDGYYMTDNTGSSNKVWALERDEMLLGSPDAGVQSFDLPGIETSGFYSPQAFNVTDDNMPAAGSMPVVFLQDDAWGGVDDDHFKMWIIDVDWEDEANSSISLPLEYETEDFISVFDGGSFSNLIQPGGGSEIDALQSTIMNQAQFKKFDAYNTMLFNFVVDVDASDDELAGVRWFELRQEADGLPWVMLQEGTYTAPDGKHAWMASMMMDALGNIGMGYTSMAGPTTENPTDHRVSVNYTGRYSSDPSGVMTIEEGLIGQGDADIPGFRYGDYGKLDIDPNNNKEFWFISEYMHGGGKDVVGTFQIASDFENDIGVISIDSPQTGALTGTETMEVTVFNYGLLDAEGFDVTFQIDGGDIITEPFVGILASATSQQFTFVATGDFGVEGQVYEIVSSTVYDLDEFTENDDASTVVMHLFQNDVGVTAITDPSDGTDVDVAAAVTIEIKNFGSLTQTSIPVYFTLDGGTPVAETYTGSIASGASDNYTFTGTMDLSAFGDYEIVAGTELIPDAIEENDDSFKTVTKFYCSPETNCEGFNDGVTILQLADQDLECECDPSGYSDNTDIIFNFVLEDNPFDGVIQAGFGDTDYAIWIDFNDNAQFEESELIANDNIDNEDEDNFFTSDLASFTNLTTGMHLMRVRGIWSSSFEDLDDPACDDVQFGRTNDYTANITGDFIGVGEGVIKPADLTIAALENNQFNLILTTAQYSSELPVSILDVNGRVLAYYTLNNSGGRYQKIIDMSYVSTGVYFVKVGKDGMNLVKRIVVK